MWILVASTLVSPANPQGWVMFVSVFCFVMTFLWLILFACGVHKNSSAWAAAVSREQIIGCDYMYIIYIYMIVLYLLCAGLHLPSDCCCVLSERLSDPSLYNNQHEIMECSNHISLQVLSDRHLSSGKHKMHTLLVLASTSSCSFLQYTWIFFH